MVCHATRMETMRVIAKSNHDYAGEEVWHLF